MSYRLLTLAFLVAFSSSLALAQDRFALALNAQGNLVIFGPSNERTEITVPTISKSVTVGATSFQVSFGRDANDLLTVILAPDASQPQDLHFDVVGKKVDADKQAVITLTFPSPNRVRIDPGYVGTVTVDSEPIRHREMAESSAAPAMTPMATSSVVQPRPLPPPVSQPDPAPVSRAVPVASNNDPVPSRSMASDPPSSSDPVDPAANGYQPIPGILPTPFMGSLASQPPVGFGAASPSNSPNSGKLFWSEPITPPSGNPPSVGLNQMKLVEIQGDVTIKFADGETKTAEDGMLLPSGATLSTASNSSAAVFMGGVNSVRFLPDSEAKISQKLDGSVRHTSINLAGGTVFSRVGHRSGESQDYQVSTPEGVAAARGTEFCDYRGTGSDGKTHHYVFVAEGVVQCFVAGQVYKVVAGAGGDLGAASMPPSGDEKAIIHAILVTLQPYNLKLAGVLERIADGTATSGDLAFYNATINFFNDLSTIVNTYKDTPRPLENIIPAARRALNQILEPFGTVPLTPF